MAGTNEQGYDATTEYDVYVELSVGGTYSVVKTTATGSTTTQESFTADTPKLFILKADESIEIKDIPANATYEVTETAPTKTGYSKVSIEPDNGTITTGTTSAVTVNNKYTYTAPAPKVGNLKVTKKVAGTNEQGYEANTEYEIFVELSVDGTFDVVKVSGSTSTTTQEQFTAGTPKLFKLKADESIEIQDIPENTTYKITETDPTKAGYSKVSIEPSSGTIASGTTSEVTVNNKYTYTAPATGSLLITKKITEGKNAQGYNATIEFDIGVKLSEGGTFTVVKNGTTTTQEIFNADEVKTFKLKADDYIEIQGIPANATFEVTETDPTVSGYSKVSIPNANGTIGSGVAKEVIVNNKYEYIAPAPGSLKIEKRITEGKDQDGYNASTEFQINVTLSSTGTFDVVKNGVTVPTAFVAGEARTLTLKADESLEIQGVPDGTTYTVTETDPTVPGYSKVSIDNGTGTVSSNAAVTVTVYNKYSNPNTPTPTDTPTPTPTNTPTPTPTNTPTPVPTPTDTPTPVPTPTDAPTPTPGLGGDKDTPTPTPTDTSTPTPTGGTQGGRRRPKTGDTGNAVMTATGSILILLAAAILVFRKRLFQNFEE